MTPKSDTGRSESRFSIQNRLSQTSASNEVTLAPIVQTVPDAPVQLDAETAFNPRCLRAAVFGPGPRPTILKGAIQ